MPLGQEIMSLPIHPSIKNQLQSIRSKAQEDINSGVVAQITQVPEPTRVESTEESRMLQHSLWEEERDLREWQMLLGLELTILQLRLIREEVLWAQKAKTTSEQMMDLDLVLTSQRVGLTIEVQVLVNQEKPR